MHAVTPTPCELEATLARQAQGRDDQFVAADHALKAPTSAEGAFLAPGGLARLASLDSMGLAEARATYWRNVEGCVYPRTDGL